VLLATERVHGGKIEKINKNKVLREKAEIISQSVVEEENGSIEEDC
jgi:hypothetical protein